MPQSGRLYDVYELLNLLNPYTPERVRKVFQERLKVGIHPFFLQQVLRFLVNLAPLTRAENTSLEDAANRVLASAQAKFEPVPISRRTGVESGVSRLYTEDNKPVLVGEGVIHGAVVETIAVILEQAYEPGKGLLARKASAAFEKLLQHPSANLSVYKALVMCMNSFEQRMLRVGSSIQIRWTETEADFVKRQLKAIALEELVPAYLDLWLSQESGQFWTMFSVLTQAIWQFVPTSKFPGTKLVRCMLSANKSKNQHLMGAAREFLGTTQVRKGGVAETFLYGVHILLAGMLRRELSNLETYHIIVRWLQASFPASRESIVTNLVFEESGKKVSPKLRFFFEDIIGPEAWKALCELTRNEFWEDVEIPLIGQTIRSNLNRNTPEYRLFAKKVRDSNIERHNADLAEYVDKLVRKAVSDIRQAHGIWKEVNDLLASDIVCTTTHLPVQFKPVLRKDEHFLASELSMISLSIHPKFKESGSACAFQITLPEVSHVPISGTLDPEGIIDFRNIAVLMPLTRLSLQAVVIQIVGSVLIPQYLNKLPPKGKKGLGEPVVGEPYLTQPLIHILGELSDEPPPAPPIYIGTRINPWIALEAFRWLIGESGEPYRLHVRSAEKVERIDEVFFVRYNEARELLLSRQLRLRDVCLQIVRAYTKPLGPRIDKEGKIVMQAISPRALRNYERFRLDTGRVLDLTDVQKTYRLPEGRQIVLNVPRTFNQGTFSTLEEVLDFVFDAAVKAKAKQLFLL